MLRCYPGNKSPVISESNGTEVRGFMSVLCTAGMMSREDTRCCRGHAGSSDLGALLK